MRDPRGFDVGEKLTEKLGYGENMQIDPETAAFLRKLAEGNRNLQHKFKALAEQYHKLSSAYEGSAMELKALRKELRKAAERIRYIEDIPGKRVPYFMQFEITIPGPNAPTVSIAGSRMSDTKQVSQDGPFVCTQYLSAFLMRTFSLGPYGDEETGRPNDPAAGAEVITPLSGRFRPVASTADPFAGAYIGTVGAASVGAAQTNQGFRPGIIDFLFEVADEGVDRLRQNNVPIPSRYLFSEFDRPLYLPVSDFFERGSAIKFSATLTRDLGFAEINYADSPTGFSEGDLNPAPDPTSIDPAGIGRAVVSIGGTLYFTMLGYKILQAQSPAI